ncbi:hypothetical protein ACLOJK_038905 [Asimina triloba]
MRAVQVGYGIRLRLEFRGSGVGPNLLLRIGLRRWTMMCVGCHVGFDLAAMGKGAVGRILRLEKRPWPNLRETVWVAVWVADVAADFNFLDTHPWLFGVDRDAPVGFTGHGRGVMA